MEGVARMLADNALRVRAEGLLCMLEGKGRQGKIVMIFGPFGYYNS